jgi:ubiquinone/menaquinone biosynthesis C-methylase UbiE
MTNNDENAQAILAWNTVLFEKFCTFQYVLTVGLEQHGVQAMQRHPVARGARVLDIGSGFGDATRALARMVGPRGEAVGVDCAENFVELARRDAARAAIDNARFVACNVQNAALDGPYQHAFSRFGTMFFASPVAALRNVRSALVDGGELTLVVWRKREDNAWLYAAERCVRELVDLPAETDQPHCGPGPFSMASADVVSDQLVAAGFDHIGFERYDCEICIGRDLDEAVSFAIALGPAGEIMRLAGADRDHRALPVRRALRETLSGFVSKDGVFAPSSTWIVNARRAPRAIGQSRVDAGEGR